MNGENLSRGGQTRSAALGRTCMCLLSAGAMAAALLSGCASSGSESANRPSSASQARPAAFELSDTDKADIQCAKELSSEAKKLCKPTENVSAGHLVLVLDVWKSFGKRCLPGMRAAAELRRLEKCIDRLEEVPGMVDEEVIQRRIDGRGVVAAIKASPEYEKAAREIQEALRQFGDLAWQCTQAVEKEDAESVRSACGSWRAMEERYSRARRTIETMMVDHGLSPMDARYLGLL